MTSVCEDHPVFSNLNQLILNSLLILFMFITLYNRWNKSTSDSVIDYWWGGGGGQPFHFFFFF